MALNIKLRKSTAGKDMQGRVCLPNNFWNLHLKCLKRSNNCCHGVSQCSTIGIMLMINIRNNFHLAKLDLRILVGLQWHSIIVLIIHAWIMKHIKRWQYTFKCQFVLLEIFCSQYNHGMWLFFTFMSKNFNMYYMYIPTIYMLRILNSKSKFF